jgi:hypothetical protein
LTLRELLAMAEAQSRSEWSRCSSLMALLANLQRDPKKTRAFRPGDFDPFVKSNPVPIVGLEGLKEMFVHGCVRKQEA